MSRLDIFSFFTTCKTSPTFWPFQSYILFLVASAFRGFGPIFQSINSDTNFFQPRQKPPSLSSLSLSRIQFIHFLSLEFYSLIFNVSLSSPAPMLGLQRHHYQIPLKLQKWCSRDASSPPRNPTPPARTDPTPTPTPPDPSPPTPRSDRTRKSPNPPPRKTTSLLSAKHKQKMEPRRKIPKTNKL
jgi:hypothetical protein